MARIRVLFFASLKDCAGTASMDVVVAESATVASLREELAARAPRLAPALPTAIAARNHEFAQAEEKLADGDEVAFFPPVSGGGEMPTHVHVVSGRLDLDEVMAQIVLPTTGAVGVFTGVVRAETRRGEARDTQYLEYEAYVPMAEAKMRQVADEIRTRWPLVEGIAIVQRVGRLDPGTPTVLIACGAPHRDMGIFEAARYGIDRLKEIVPVWKKEVGRSGETWVEGDYHPTQDDTAQASRRHEP
jgi:molybdopterin converting factor subunit 1